MYSNVTIQGENKYTSILKLKSNIKFRNLSKQCPTISILSNTGCNGGKVLIEENAINHNNYSAIIMQHFNGTTVQYISFYDNDVAICDYNIVTNNIIMSTCTTVNNSTGTHNVITGNIINTPQ